jgi:hypothetical protein
MEKERNRNLLLYEFKCGHSAAATTRNICRLEDAGTVKESAMVCEISEWGKRS